MPRLRPQDGQGGSGLATLRSGSYLFAGQPDQALIDRDISVALADDTTRHENYSRPVDPRTKTKHLRRLRPDGGVVTEDCKSLHPSSILGQASKSS